MFRLIGNLLSVIIAAGFLTWVIGTVIGGLLYFVAFIFAEIKWPHTYRKSGSRNGLGLYIRTVPGKEKEDNEKTAWMGNALSVTMKVAYVIAGIISLVIVYNLLADKF